MPLSKKRDKERKQLERRASKSAHYALDLKREEASIRLEKLVSPPQASNPVQPHALQSTTRPLKEESNSRLPVKPSKMYMAGVEIGTPDIDAGGEVVPGYW